MIIWLASYPKSGNTWVRSIVNQLIHNDIKKKEDVFEGLIKIRRYPSRGDFINLPRIPKNYSELQKKELINYTIKNWKYSQENINKNKEVKIFKTHNMLCKLEVENKHYVFTDISNSIGAIHVVRDPRNIVSSVMNHFNHNDISESIDMIKFQYTWTGFKNDEVPQFLSSWSNHYNSWKRFPKNYLLIKYEDLIKDTKSEIKKLIKFLSIFFKIDVNENDINSIISNTSFDNLSELEKKGKFNENTFDKSGEQNKFFYLGPKNNWKNILNEKDVQLLNSYFEKEMKELGYL